MRSIRVLFIAFLLTHLSFPQGGISAEKDDPYLIGREDVLDITVWQSPDLTKVVTVNSDGTIDYPLLGNLQAAGLTQAALTKVIHDKLARGYVKDPQVSVTIKEYNSKKVLVFGEVTKAGLYKLRGEIPLLELLFMVGGVTGDAKRMTIIRPPGNLVDVNPAETMIYSQEGNPSSSATAIEIDLIALLSRGDLSQNIAIKPGDTIYVSSGTGQRYYVLGQVKRPGPYEWIQDITVLEAIKLADGVTDRGAPNRIKVRKNIGGRQEEIKIDLTDIMKGKKKDDIVIKPGDTIIVPESWI